jgi:predicted transcriptional regulator
MDPLTELRRRRLALGIPLGELARAVGRSDATLSRVERGQIRPSYELVQKIVQYLDQHEGAATRPLRAADVMNRTVVTVEGSADLGRASQLLERGGFSQLPVVDGGRVTGSISESALLRGLAAPDGRRVKVREIQEVAYPQVDQSFPADLLTGLLGRYSAVLVVHRGELDGIITRADLIRGLRGASFRRPNALTEATDAPLPAASVAARRPERPPGR